VGVGGEGTVERVALAGGRAEGREEVGGRERREGGGRETG